MRKLIGLGMLLALIVAPMATAVSNAAETYNVYPALVSSVGSVSSFIAVSNLTDANWDVDTTGQLFAIREAFGGFIARTTKFDVPAGETLFIDPTDMGCIAGNVCKLTLCIPALATQANPYIVGAVVGGTGAGSTNATVGVPLDTATPAMDSMQFWTNDGAIVAITSPIAYGAASGTVCPNPS